MQYGLLAMAIDRAAARGAVIAIDDAGRLSAGELAALERVVARDAALLAVVTASDAAIGDRSASHRIDVELPALAYEDAERLVRELLRPARLIPAVLVERLAIRAGGNPGVLVALAAEMTRRGAVRRQAGGGDWYVAADELDTLLAAPSPAWFAIRALEDLPAGLHALVRTCAGLGPQFSADEIAAVLGDDNLEPQLAWLVRHDVLDEAAGGYAFRDAAVQDALVDHVLDERDRVHAGAFRFWAERDGVDATARLTRLAFHGAGAREPIIAATCWIALGEAARSRGELDVAEDVLGRAAVCLARAARRPDLAAPTTQLAASLSEILAHERSKRM